MTKFDTAGKVAQDAAKRLRSKAFQKKPQGNESYPDPMVARFLSKVDPVRKEQNQDTLFTNATGLPRLSKINPAASRSILQGGDGNGKASGIPRVGSGMFGLSSSGRLQRNIDYSSQKDIQWMTFESRRPDISESYKEILEENSICLIVDDISDTDTDVNYKNKVEDPIKEFESVPDTTKFLNVEKTMFSDILTEDKVLQEVVSKLKTLSSTKVEKIGSFLKLISIPSHSIEITPKIIDVLQTHKSSYKLVALYVNLDRSPQLTKELASISKSFASDTKEVNYETLLKRAIDSHTEDTVSKSIMKKIGESSLLKLSTTEKSISFTIVDAEKTKINTKVSS